MGMGVGGGGDKKARPAPVINITPLVDVVLVVLIIFMIVTTMMTRTFWLNLPKSEKKDADDTPNDNKPLVLTVDKQGVIHANQTVLAKQEVQGRVIRMLSAKNQRTLFFDAHDEVPYQTVVETVDLVRAGGVKSIAMLTEPIVK
jgi:biopolymer transport protein ExbD/biopolymer transport protein TolR